MLHSAGVRKSEVVYTQLYTQDVSATQSVIALFLHAIPRVVVRCVAFFFVESARVESVSAAPLNWGLPQRQTNDRLATENFSYWEIHWYTHFRYYSYTVFHVYLCRECASWIKHEVSCRKPRRSVTRRALNSKMPSTIWTLNKRWRTSFRSARSTSKSLIRWVSKKLKQNGCSCHRSMYVCLPSLLFENHEL